MLQTFIDSKYKSMGCSTTEEECTGLIIAILFGAQFTSSITSTWIGAHLLSCKQYMARILEEQKAVMWRHGDKLDIDVLSEMDVLQRAMKEALQFNPPVPLALRYCHPDFLVTTSEGKKYTIPKRHIVATAPAIANRSPYVYKDPNSFDPDRFAPGRDEDTKAGPHSYLSFGAGRRGCRGKTFAYMVIKTIWSILLCWFELELISPFPEPDWNGVMVGVKGEVMVRYK